MPQLKVQRKLILQQPEKFDGGYSEQAGSQETSQSTSEAAVAVSFSLYTTCPVRRTELHADPSGYLLSRGCDEARALLLVPITRGAIIRAPVSVVMGVRPTTVLVAV